MRLDDCYTAAKLNNLTYFGIVDQMYCFGGNDLTQVESQWVDSRCGELSELPLQRRCRHAGACQGVHACLMRPQLRSDVHGGTAQLGCGRQAGRCMQHGGVRCDEVPPCRRRCCAYLPGAAWRVQHVQDGVLPRHLRLPRPLRRPKPRLLLQHGRMP